MSGVSAFGGHGPCGTMEPPTLTSPATRDARPPTASSPIHGCPQPGPSKPSQVPDPQKRRGRRHPLAGLLAVGIEMRRDIGLDILASHPAPPRQHQSKRGGKP